MTALRNVGLGLAAMVHRRAYTRLSALVSLFLATVSSSVGGDAGQAVLLPLSGFGVSGMLWLIMVYWEGLGPKLNMPGRLAGSSCGSRPGHWRSLRWSWRSGSWVLAGGDRAAALVPTSGGIDWSDPDARSGVGDGDNEVAASERPESVGFTESELYLETDRPSLYDAFNETYGQPLKPKKREKMVALAPQNVGEQKDRPAENLPRAVSFRPSGASRSNVTDGPANERRRL